MKNQEKINDDKDLLMRAVAIAIGGIGKGGGPFGALVTKNGEIIAEAYNKVVFSGDPTAHAEILAIRKASEVTGSHDLSDCTIYASCEPCPMCLGAIYWAGIKRVFFASGRSDAAKAGFGDELFYEEIMKSPDKRKISFIRIGEVDGSEVFKIWDLFENKISY
jgi:guanine deaminase